MTGATPRAVSICPSNSSTTTPPRSSCRPRTLPRHGYFIRDVLPPLRERLLILAELLLATPADARSTLPSRLAAALQRRGHLAQNYLLESIDPLIATRVLAHTSAHTGVDIPSLTTSPSGSDAPPAVHHARVLAAWLMRRTALASWPAVAAIIGGHPDNIGQNDHWYRAALTRNSDFAAELDRLLRGVEDWHAPAPAHPATAHHERMRDLARAIQGYAATLLTSGHGPNMARHASIAACREHTDLTSREIALIHNVNHAQPTFAHATVERRRCKSPDFDERYRQLLDHAHELQRQAGFASANLKRGLTRQAGRR